MSTHKLTYFNGRGRAEIIRLVLTAAGAKFEDIRIEEEDGAEFKQLQPSLPFRQLPIFEIDGKGPPLCQSFAIARYLARQYKLAGKTDLEQAQADMIVDCIEDSLKPIHAFAWQESDPTKKAALKKKYVEEQLPVFLANLEKLLSANKGGDGYFVGDALTWADLYVVAAQDTLELQAGLTTAINSYPKLFALFNRVTKLPKIAEYRANLAITAF